MKVVEPYIIFPRTLKSGRIVYYYQYRREDGSRSNPQSTGEVVLSKAKRKIQRMYNEGAFDIKAERESVKFADFVKGFFDKNNKYYEYQALTGKPIKDSTLASYVKILNNQLIPFFENKKISDINKDCIKEWVLWASPMWSAKTINNAHGVLNIILESATDKELLARNPLAGVKYRPIQKKERQLLTVDEICRIYRSELWSRDTQRTMFLLAAITGMRIGEISALKKENLHENYIDVKYTYSDKFGLGSTKTGVCRKVPIVAGFDYGTSHTEWVFEGLTTEKPMLSHAVYNAFSRICDNLNVERKERGITIHSLRNFFISYLQGENVPENKIKAVVGHSDKSNMTDHYTYWNSEMLKEVYTAQDKLYRKIKE